MLRLNDRVIQIPRDGWPSREGMIVSVDESGGQVFIAWKDGRKEWVHEADFRNDDIWLLEPNKVKA